MRVLQIGIVLLAASVMGRTPAQVFPQNGTVIGTANSTVLKTVSPNGTLMSTASSFTTIGRVLQDRSTPNSFLVTGTVPPGHVARLSFTDPFTTSTVGIGRAPSNSVGQLSWDQNGQDLIIVDGGSPHQIHRMDPASGAVTSLTMGTQPWSTLLRSGAMDPVTGDIYVGTGNGNIYRVTANSWVVTQVGGTGVSSNIVKVLPGRDVTDRYVYFMTNQNLYRLAMNNPNVVESMSTSVPSNGLFRTFCRDAQGNFLVTTTSQGIFRIANQATIPAGGLPLVFFASFPAGGQSPSDIIQVGSFDDPFSLRLQSTGSLGGFVELRNIPPSNAFGWLLLTGATFLPMGSGPLFGIFPDQLTLSILASPPTPGGLLAFSGAAPIQLTLPPGSMAAVAGQQWDGTAVSFDIGGNYLGQSNLERVLWQ